MGMMVYQEIPQQATNWTEEDNLIYSYTSFKKSKVCVDIFFHNLNCFPSRRDYKSAHFKLDF